MRLSLTQSAAWASALLALEFISPARCQQGSAQIYLYSDTTCEKLITTETIEVAGTIGCAVNVQGTIFDSAILISASNVGQVYMCEAGFNCGDPGSQTENLLEAEGQCIGAIGSANFDKFQICAPV
jgi:hypothetical protein